MITFQITRSVWTQISQTLGQRLPECGGVLGLDSDHIISHYYFDATGKSTPNSYRPDTAAINRMIVSQWRPLGVRMIGIVHSHAAGCPVPSCMDIRYGERILQALDTADHFFLPIVTVENGQVQLHPYVLQYEDTRMVCRQVPYEIITATPTKKGAFP